MVAYGKVLFGWMFFKVFIVFSPKNGCSSKYPCITHVHTPRYLDGELWENCDLIGVFWENCELMGVLFLSWGRTFVPSHKENATPSLGLLWANYKTLLCSAHGYHKPVVWIVLLCWELLFTRMQIGTYQNQGKGTKGWPPTRYFRENGTHQVIVSYSTPIQANVSHCTNRKWASGEIFSLKYKNTYRNKQEPGQRHKRLTH